MHLVGFTIEIYLRKSGISKCPGIHFPKGGSNECFLLAVNP